ncbi:MAG: site-specific DNA-methyltransferase, partial [Anaerolineales bacterium]
MHAWRLLEGHVTDKLRELPDESVHCVVTSPPYWLLRDYGLPGQVWG